MKAANLLALVIVAGVSAGIGYYVGTDMSMSPKGEAEAPATNVTTKAPAADDAVVATVNGVEIRESDVTNLYANLPQQYKQVPFEMIKSQLVDQLVSMKIVQKAAKDEKYNEQAGYLDRVADAKDQILQEFYLQEKMTAAASEEAVNAAYEKLKSEFEPKEEIRARHILVEKEEEARDVVAKLDAGEDFVELAKTTSVGPSGPQGGDLGFFGEGQMVKPFSDAAFAMEPGTYTKEPVKTQFGWHVIKLEERRNTQPPALEQVRGELENQISNEAVSTLIDDLRGKATIDIVGEKKDEAASEEADKAKQ
ncbi:peptidylprolyl isomerase [Sneathiella sp. P13V-1]|uniref:peptidylprolyl isomerase n=1 Tax=Sneathiella sp. P13V-1 TaxID=2697366 RepID=UPI00187B82F6|nr:peptidylprolyl isomerase [Sneathiella sp. P13V-1]MBE7636549.1 peptidylprolyl isomerase [Sneathiella sp. P13V-1]